MTMFERWCVLHGHKPFGASPAIVAQFVAGIAPMGIAAVWEAVQEVARMHSAHNLPDPTVNPCVAAAVNDIAKIDPPRWSDSEKLRFKMLPYDVQLFISERERDRDKYVRTLQQELATLKRKIDGTLTAETAEQAAA